MPSVADNKPFFSFLVFFGGVDPGVATVVEIGVEAGVALVVGVAEAVGVVGDLGNFCGFVGEGLGLFTNFFSGDTDFLLGGCG